MDNLKPRLHLVGSSGTAETPADLDDDDLMVLARAGRQDAFEALVDRYQSLVLALATRFFGDKVAGRDVAQDVFLALWAERERYKAQGKFRSYLTSMTLHRCHAVVRKRKTRSAYLDREASARVAPERASSESLAEELPLRSVVEQEKARQLREALARIPEKQRRVLVLRFSLELTFEEIASVTGLPLGTVKSHAFRGLKRVRALLVEE